MLDMEIVYYKQRRRCPKHKRSKIMHHCVSGYTRSNTRCSSFQLWLYEHIQDKKQRAKYSILFFFPWRFLPLATHLAIICSTVPEALISLFAKRHTRNYNFKQWPEVINLIPFSGPPGCRHLAMKPRKNSFGGNGHAISRTHQTKTVWEKHIFGKVQKEGEKNVLSL